MRLPWLLLWLIIPSALLAAEEPAPADQPDDQLYWQTQDWQEAGQAKQIGNQVTLLHKSDQGYRLGLALLLPDWQQVADLLPLSRALNRQGFDTLIMLPNPTQLTLDPNDEKDQLAIQAFKERCQPAGEQWRRERLSTDDCRGKQCRLALQPAEQRVHRPTGCSGADRCLLSRRRCQRNFGPRCGHRALSGTRSLSRTTGQLAGSSRQRTSSGGESQRQARLAAGGHPNIGRARGTAHRLVALSGLEVTRQEIS